MEKNDFFEILGIIILVALGITFIGAAIAVILLLLGIVSIIFVPFILSFAPCMFMLIPFVYIASKVDTGDSKNKKTENDVVNQESPDVDTSSKLSEAIRNMAAQAVDNNKTEK